MQMSSVGGVRVAHWNPRRQLNLRPRRLFAWTRKAPLGRRVNNFGDLFGPIVVEQVAERACVPLQSDLSTCHVVGAVGSIIHMLPEGAVVWGAGVNGKHLELPLPHNLDFRAVRGPLTQRYLSDKGCLVPDVYGDPALIVDYARWGVKRHSGNGDGVVCIQNLNDPSLIRAGATVPGVRFVSPVAPVERVVRAIAGANLVVGSSLHAIIVAEALGVPARVVRSRAEPSFKYEDYYEGTGRAGIRTATTVVEAVGMGGVDEPVIVDPRLERAFPLDLWGPVDA